MLKDVGAWFPKLKKGGLMSGHDATPKWEGVLRGAYEWAMLHEDHTLEFACCEPNTAGVPLGRGGATRCIPIGPVPFFWGGGGMQWKPPPPPLGAPSLR